MHYITIAVHDIPLGAENWRVPVRPTALWQRSECLLQKPERFGGPLDTAGDLASAVRCNLQRNLTRLGRMSYFR
jgi:hypothetical protein